MHNARFRLTTAIAGATMCVFAVTASGQTTPTTTGTTTGTQTPTAGTTTPATTGTAGTSTNAGGYNGTAATPAGTDQTIGGTTTGTTTTGTTTTTTDGTLAPIDNTSVDNGNNRGFPWGILGLLGLLGLFKGRSTEVRRDTYATTTPGARTTTVGTGTAYDDRTATPRAASGVSTTGGTGTGTGTGGSGTMGDPGSRR
jgi:hypothetical protein